MLLYAGFYYHLSSYFQFCLFVLMIILAVMGLFIGSRLKDLQSLTIFKRVSAGSWFALLATNLLTGLGDKNIYYVVLPWILLYPVAAIMFFSRRFGVAVGSTFSVVAAVIFLTNEMPPLDAPNIRMFQFNAVFALLTILLLSVIYEKMRMKIQDDLARSENQYKLAEMHQ